MWELLALQQYCLIRRMQQLTGLIYAIPMQNEQRVLGPGELHSGKKFGADTVNRGAVLFECEWDGGQFESGLFMGGMFRSGQFAGGIFLGGIFWGGKWVSGTWEGGFDRGGIYRSRDNSPDSF
jgi:hypothetical protein